MLKWVLQECGFNQLVFGGGSSENSVREVFSSSTEPVLLLASSSWDTSHVYLEVKGEGRTLAIGRWKQVVQEINGKLEGEKVKEITEVGSVLIAKTSCDRLLSVSPHGVGELVVAGNITESTNQSGVDAVYPSPGSSSQLYVRLDNGRVYSAAFTAESSIQINNPVIPSVPVEKVSCGSDHMLLLSNGRVWSCGLNHRGQLGLGDLQGRTEPVVVEALDGIPFDDISCGNWHNLVLSRFGDIYSWGWNADQQLGHSADSATVAIPMLVDVSEGERSFRCVRSGARHSAALSVCGLLYTWGWNGYQQLGHPKCAGPVSVPIQPGAKVVWLHCKPWSTLFLTHVS